MATTSQGEGHIEVEGGRDIDVFCNGERLESQDSVWEGVVLEHRTDDAVLRVVVTCHTDLTVVADYWNDPDAAYENPSGDHVLFESVETDDVFARFEARDDHDLTIELRKVMADG